MSTSSTRPSSPSLFNLQVDIDNADVIALLPTSRRTPHRRAGGVFCTLLPHPTSIRRGSRVSNVRFHGAKYCQTRNSEIHKWLCDYSDKSVGRIANQGNSNVTRHLRDLHHLVLKRQRSEVGESNYYASSESAATALLREGLHSRQKDAVPVVDNC